MVEYWQISALITIWEEEIQGLLYVSTISKGVQEKIAQKLQENTGFKRTAAIQCREKMKKLQMNEASQQV